MKKYFYFAIVFLVMFSCENEDLDEISSKANNTANIAPLSENIAQMVPPYRSVGTARSGSVVPLISV